MFEHSVERSLRARHAVFTSAPAISDDGRVIVRHRTDPDGATQAWRAGLGR